MLDEALSTAAATVKYWAAVITLCLASMSNKCCGFVWSPAHTSLTEACHRYCTPNCTGSTCPSESRASSASWCTVACMVRCCNNWSTSAYQYPTSLLGSISDPPVDNSWIFFDSGCKHMVDRLSLLLAHWPGTHCPTIWEMERQLPQTGRAIGLHAGHQCPLSALHGAGTTVNMCVPLAVLCRHPPDSQWTSHWAPANMFCDKFV